MIEVKHAIKANQNLQNVLNPPSNECDMHGNYSQIRQQRSRGNSNITIYAIRRPSS